MNRVSPLVLRRVAFHSVCNVAFHFVKGRSFAERKTTLGDALIPPRRGATLVEVLMALLIMAVGVTSVFTLFPISIIKAIKANQLTNAKLYEGAIQDTLLTHPQLWTGAPAWSENTRYGQAGTVATIENRWVTPKPDGRMMPSTNQLFSCVAATPGTSGTREPAFEYSTNWSHPNSTGGYRSTAVGPGLTAAQDGPLTWTARRHSPYLANRLWSAYVVDPLGWHRPIQLIDQAQFGEIVSADASVAANTIHLDRIHCQLAAGAANGIFRLQDSWNVVLGTTPVTLTTPPPSATQIEIQFPPEVASTVDSNSFSTPHRIVLTSTLNSPVAVLPITGASNPSVGSPNLTITGTLPTGFVPADFDQARIEIQAPGRYSWLMAVHSGPRGEYNAQCAVVFNRSFETVDEQGYRAEFCVTEDVDGDGVIDAGEDAMLPNGRLDTNIAKVRWLYDPDTDPPKLKEGGYIFDASFGYWYKIQKIEVDQERVNGNVAGTVIDTPNTIGTYVRTIMTLSDQVQVSSSTVTAGTAYFTDYGVYDPATTKLYDCQAVLMPGVVHVFTPEPPQ